LAVSLALSVAAPAAAQVQTGSILVRAADQQGAVMPGVTVTITSSVLVAGSMTAVTDAGGVFRFPSLVPGTYGVKMELTGFQTVNREARLSDKVTAAILETIASNQLKPGDLLPPEWMRLTAGVEGLTGILMCGWSTGFFFAVVSPMFEAKARPVTATAVPSIK
jgi:hypothetical protein